MSSNNFPEYQVINFSIDPQSGYFLKTDSTSTASILPEELKIETTKSAEIRQNGAPYILTSRVKNNRRQYFTGMQEIGLPDYYVGNDFKFIKGKKVTSLNIIYYSVKDGELKVFYFINWNRRNTGQRIKFAKEFIQSRLGLIQ